MNTPPAKQARLVSVLAGAALALLLACAPGCGPGQPAVTTYLASVTNASPAQSVADGQRVAQLFADLASRHGLLPEKPLPSDAVALYFPGATGLNLSLSALTMGPNTIALSVIPVDMGRRDNNGCRTVIATVDKTLKQAFGARLLTSP
jgi:hypothetical protein